MGSLRFLLAVAVVLFHSGGLFGYALTGGGPSVQGFYIVSGFFMALILNEKYIFSADNLLFITNRLIRIYSTYWVYLALSIIFYCFSRDGAIALFVEQFHHLNAGTIAYLATSNLLIFGMDAGLFMGIHNGSLVLQEFTASPTPRVHDFFLIPQAWSLGVELSFYLLAPFLLRRHWSVVLAVATLGLVARIAAGFDGDPWTNRFFPFELTIFLLGGLAYHRFARIKHRSLARWEKIAALFPVILVICYPLYGGESWFFQTGRLVFLAGLAGGLPYLFHMTRNITLDRSLGELSYPVYLCHELVISLVALTPHLSGNGSALVALALSIAVASATVTFIEAPVDRLRQSRWLSRAPAIS